MRSPVAVLSVSLLAALALLPRGQAATVTGFVNNASFAVLGTNAKVAFLPLGTPLISGGTTYVSRAVSTNLNLEGWFSVQLVAGRYTMRMEDSPRDQFTLGVPTDAGPFGFNELVTNAVNFAATNAWLMQGQIDVRTNGARLALGPTQWNFNGWTGVLSGRTITMNPTNAGGGGSGGSATNAIATVQTNGTNVATGATTLGFSNPPAATVLFTATAESSSRPVIFANVASGVTNDMNNRIASSEGRLDDAEASIAGLTAYDATLLALQNARSNVTWLADNFATNWANAISNLSYALEYSKQPATFALSNIPASLLALTNLAGSKQHGSAVLTNLTGTGALTNSTAFIGSASGGQGTNTDIHGSLEAFADVFIATNLWATGNVVVLKSDGAPGFKIYGSAPGKLGFFNADDAEMILQAGDGYIETSGADFYVRGGGFNSALSVNGAVNQNALLLEVLQGGVSGTRQWIAVSSNGLTVLRGAVNATNTTIRTNLTLASAPSSAPPSLSLISSNGFSGEMFSVLPDWKPTNRHTFKGTNWSAGQVWSAHSVTPNSGGIVDVLWTNGGPVNFPAGGSLAGTFSGDPVFSGSPSVLGDNWKLYYDTGDDVLWITNLFRQTAIRLRDNVILAEPSAGQISAGQTNVTVNANGALAYTAVAAGVPDPLSVSQLNVGSISVTGSVTAAGFNSTGAVVIVVSNPATGSLPSLVLSNNQAATSTVAVKGSPSIQLFHNGFAGTTNLPGSWTISSIPDTGGASSHSLTISNMYQGNWGRSAYWSAINAFGVASFNNSGDVVAGNAGFYIANNTGGYNLGTSGARGKIVSDGTSHAAFKTALDLPGVSFWSGNFAASTNFYATNSIGTFGTNATTGFATSGFTNTSAVNVFVALKSLAAEATKFETNGTQLFVYTITNNTVSIPLKPRQWLTTAGTITTNNVETW